MKKIMILVLITFLVSLLAACGYTSTNTPSEPDDTAQINSSSIPEPVSNNSCDWECGKYYSDISASAIKTYLQELKEAGWEDMEGNEFPDEIQNGTSQYMLTKGSSILQIMIRLNDINEGIYNNSVLVKLDDDLPVSDIKSRKDAVQKKVALERIKPVIDRVAQTDEFVKARENVTGIFEVFIKDSYEKSNIQAFSAISDIGFTGSFLICKDSVLHVPGGLDNTCVADIDMDDNYELLVLDHTYHSDIYAIDLYAYKYYNPAYLSSSAKLLGLPYQNRFVPKFGYPKLSFRKLSDTEVKLISTDTDYGILKINGSAIGVENTRAFPIKQWEDSYDQTKLEKLNKEIPKDPPPINISIGGQNLDYIVQTIKWNGTAYENNSDYGEVMRRNYTIPTFEINNNDIKSVRIDFGKSIPDTIKVSDSMLDRNGNNRYTNKEIMDRAVEIIDNSRVEFQMEQHIAYYLSSNMEDYKKDWYRLFIIKCTWGNNECKYSFLINTRNAW